MSDRLLSQAEIDALLRGGGPRPSGQPPAQGQSRPAEPQSSPAQHNPAGARHPQPVDPATRMMLDTLMQRLEAMSAALERLDRLERAVVELSTALKRTRYDFQAMSNHVQLLNAKVDGILSNLKCTVGYRAQKTFVCGNCRTRGELAVRVKCTHCGRENWWGWWPPEK